MRILVIDDDVDIVRIVQQYLQPDGHVVLGAHDAREGLRLVVSWRPDLILLDIVMPDMDGRRLCERVRGISRVPIIFLTGLGGENDIISAFGAGADEYLVKPPRSHELRARVRAMLRWSRTPGGSQDYYDDGYLLVDIPTRQVQKQGVRVNLSPIEFRLLACLVARHGQVISHQALLQAAWDDAEARNRAVLHLYIRHLRDKIEPEPSHPHYLHNKFGEGYWFEPHDSLSP